MAVTVAFIICWAPFHTQRLMVLYVTSWTPELLAVQSHIFYISGNQLLVCPKHTVTCQVTMYLVKVVH